MWVWVWLLVGTPNQLLLVLKLPLKKFFLMHMLVYFLLQPLLLLTELTDKLLVLEVQSVHLLFHRHFLLLTANLLCL